MIARCRGVTDEDGRVSIRLVRRMRRPKPWKPAIRTIAVNPVTIEAGSGTEETLIVPLKFGATPSDGE